MIEIRVSNIKNNYIVELVRWTWSAELLLVLVSSVSTPLHTTSSQLAMTSGAVRQEGMVGGFVLFKNLEAVDDQNYSWPNLGVLSTGALIKSS